MSNTAAFWLVWFGAALGCALCFAAAMAAQWAMPRIERRWAARKAARLARSARYVASDGRRGW